MSFKNTKHPFCGDADVFLNFALMAGGLNELVVKVIRRGEVAVQG